MNMEAFVLGSGGSMPLPHRSLTSVLLRREGDLFLFDCGEGTQVSMRRLNLRWKKINTIFISHTHADHVTGLPGMLMLSSQVARDEPLYVIGPPRIAEYVDQSRRVLEMYINYEIVVREIENPAMPQTVFMGDGYRVDAFPLRHTRTCVGYSLVEDGRPGVFHPERASDLGVPRGPAWARLQAGGVRRLGLIHFSPRYTDREVRAIEIEASEVFPDAFAARDRMRIDIPYADVSRHAD
jgi:ribonuclease Z